MIADRGAPECNQYVASGLGGVVERGGKLVFAVPDDTEIDDLTAGPRGRLRLRRRNSMR